MNDADVWRIAHEMIQEYGGEAHMRARLRAEKLLEHDIADGAEEWTRVAQAIAELDRKAPGADDPVN